MEDGTAGCELRQGGGKLFAPGVTLWFGVTAALGVASVPDCLMELTVVFVCLSGELERRGTTTCCNGGSPGTLSRAASFS
ncbi:hypothetical protein MRX96_030818 [Rhipicephalus microplus]